MNILWILLGVAGLRMLRKNNTAQTVVTETKKAVLPSTLKMQQEPMTLVQHEELRSELRDTLKPEQNVIVPSESKPEPYVMPEPVIVPKPHIEPEESKKLEHNVILPSEPVRQSIVSVEDVETSDILMPKGGGGYPVQIINGIEIPVFHYDPANFTSPYQVQSGKFPKRPFKRDYLTPEEVFAYFAVYLSKQNLDKVTWQLARDVYKAYTLSDRLDYYLFLNKMKEDYYTGRVKPVSLGLLKPGIYRAPYDIGMLQVYDSYVGVRYYTGNFVEDEILKFPKLRGWGTYKLVGSEKVHSLHPNSELPGLSSDQWNYYQWIAVNKSLFNVRLDNSPESQLDRLIYAFNANLEHYNLTEWTINSL